MHHEGSRAPPLVPFWRDSRFGEEWLHLYLFLLPSRQEDRKALIFSPACPMHRAAFILFALWGVVFSPRQRCAPGSRFPCGLALASHVVLFHFSVPHFQYLTGYGRAWIALRITFFPRRLHLRATAA